MRVGVCCPSFLTNRGDCDPVIEVWLTTSIILASQLYTLVRRLPRVDFQPVWYLTRVCPDLPHRTSVWCRDAAGLRFGRVPLQDVLCRVVVDPPEGHQAEAGKVRN